jgi:hypothetical protein
LKQPSSSFQLSVFNQASPDSINAAGRSGFHISTARPAAFFAINAAVFEINAAFAAILRKSLVMKAARYESRSREAHITGAFSGKAA